MLAVRYTHRTSSTGFHLPSAIFVRPQAPVGVLGVGETKTIGMVHEYVNILRFRTLE